MRFWFIANGDRFEVGGEVEKAVMIALLKAISATVVVLVPVLEALARLGG
jgi:hypothetical protein